MIMIMIMIMIMMIMDGLDGFLWEIYGFLVIMLICCMRIVVFLRFKGRVWIGGYLSILECILSISSLYSDYFSYMS